MGLCLGGWFQSLQRREGPIRDFLEVHSVNRRELVRRAPQLGAAPGSAQQLHRVRAGEPARSASDEQQWLRSGK